MLALAVWVSGLEAIFVSTLNLTLKSKLTIQLKNMLAWEPYLSTRLLRNPHLSKIPQKNFPLSVLGITFLSLFPIAPLIGHPSELPECPSK